MELTVIHATANCENSACPTIYLNEKGNYVVQGFKLNSAQKSDLQIPEGEDLIELPAEFVQAFIAKQKK